MQCFLEIMVDQAARYKAARLFSYKKYLGGIEYEQKNGRRNQERLCGGRLQG